MNAKTNTRSAGMTARLICVAMVVVTSACGGGVATTGSAVASEAEWRSLAVARPAPLDGAARVAIAEVEFLGSYPWSGPSGVEASLGVSELVATGLLRRRDVDFVERRRFAAAAEAERRGVARPRGAPAAGVSQSADYTTTAVWITLGSDQTAVEVRLATLETGQVAGATRVPVAMTADPVTLARAIIRGVIEVLGELDRLPTWSDPLQATAQAPVRDEALRHFLRGLASEEVWDWEGARRGYQAAAADPTFYEAGSALARAARLRLGGTLAES